LATAARIPHCDLHGLKLEAKPELENVDRLTAEVFGALGRVMHLNRLVMARTMMMRGIQYPEVFALALLSKHDGISQRELTSSLHLSRPRVSMILRSLEQDGCILRRPDEVDRRLSRVFITPEGTRREKEHRDILGRYVERTIGTLSEADRQELARILGELAGRLLAVLHEEQGTKPPEKNAHEPEVRTS
jgi:DNA-binding MarR family transcriptional regulator